MAPPRTGRAVDWEPGVLCQIEITVNTMPMIMYFNFSIIIYAAITLLKHLAEMALLFAINSVVDRGTAGPKFINFFMEFNLYYKDNFNTLCPFLNMVAKCFKPPHPPTLPVGQNIC